MGDLGKSIDITEFKFKGYVIEGERHKIDNSDEYFYHLFVYDPKYSMTKEHGILGITAKNMAEVKKELAKQL